MQRNADVTGAAAAHSWAFRLRTRVQAVTGWRALAVAFAAGALSILSMAPFFIWPVLLLTLPVLLWLVDAASQPSPSEKPWPHLDRRSLLRAGLVGWSFAYGYHVAGLYWLREAFLVTGGALGMLWPLGVIGLPAMLALFTGLGTAAAAALAPRGFARIVAFSLCLAATEWMRGTLFTGFPWNVYGMALTGNLVLMQSVALIGIWGLTLAAVAMFTAPLAILGERWQSSGQKDGGGRLVAALLFICPLLTFFTYGTLRLHSPPPALADGIKIRLVQPSIPQRDKWRPEKQPEFLRQQLALSLRGPDGTQDDLAGITHIIWPEAALPFLPLQRPEVLQAIADALPSHAHLVLGILRGERGPRQGAATTADEFRVFNSMAVLDGEARVVSVYDKTHLVPFGEYLPFQDFLEALGLSALTRQRGGFAIGPTPRPLLYIPGMPASAPLICYEGAFPGVGAASAGRPRVLINTTNDGWFGDSTGPRQHAHQARLRSVEEGAPLLRVANNGITAVYDPFGRELARLGMNEVGVIDTGLPGSIDPPPFAQWGNVPFALAMLAGMAWLGWRRVRYSKP